jgi:hypothetical protein
MPLLKNRRVLAAKQEVTAGTQIALSSGTDGIINAYDVQIDADIPYNERRSTGGFGRLAGVVGTYGGSLKFKVEAYGSGSAGTAPAWANVLLPSCGMTSSAGTFTPVSAWTAQKTATLAVLEDGLKKVLYGAMGTWTFHGEDGKPAYFEFDYKGIWAPPVDAAMFTPQFTTVIPPRFAGATLTIGGYTPTASKLTIAYGNTVALREDVTQVSGFISAIITDRKVTGSLDPETTAVSSQTGDETATYDAFGIWIAGTTAALTNTIGASGTGFTISAAQLQYSGIKEGDRNGKVISDLDFVATQNSTTVDSELSIAF